MYQVVASDLDGTLLSPDHTLSEYAKQTLKLLTERDIHFVFATGRHHIDVGQIRDNLGINAFMITANGARVHNTAGDLIFSHNLAPEIAAELAERVFHHPDILTNVFRNDDWLVNRPDPEHELFFKESAFQPQLFTPDQMPTDGIAKVYFSCEDHQVLLALEEEFNAKWGDRVNVSFSLPTCLEVMAGGVSKGHALDEVAKIMGYTLADCIAFGDGMNDEEMLAMAGKGCIMAGAHQRLKDHLPNLEVIGSNADNAVPHYLRAMYLNA